MIKLDTKGGGVHILEIIEVIRRERLRYCVP